MIVPICDQVRVCDWCSLGPASLFGHWRCPAWSLTLTTCSHSFHLYFQKKYLSPPTKLIWTLWTPADNLDLDAWPRGQQLTWASGFE